MLSLDPASPVPLFAQIVDSIRWRIAVGDLRTDAELPPTRAASASWGVNRHTVAKAYRELERAGVIRREGRKLHVARTPTASGHARVDASELARRVTREATAQGLTPVELIDLIRAEAGLGETRTLPSIVECTADQCEDIRRQILAATDQHLPTCLLRDPLPAGPLIGTRFHQEEMLAKWPDRARDMHFVVASLDPAVGAIVRHLSGESAPDRVILLVKDDLVAGSNLARDLAEVIGGGCRVDLLTGDAATGAASPGAPDRLTIATPAAWGMLPVAARAQPRVIRLRYAIDSDEIDYLRRIFEWPRSKRFGRPTRRTH